MEALRAKARELLESRTVQVVVGHEQGSVPGRPRPVFVRKIEDVDRLVAGEGGTINLAVYLLKPEVQALGRPALVADPAALRTVLQLASENQIRDGALVALALDDGRLTELKDLAAIEAFVAERPAGLPAEDQQRIAEIEAMSREDRWTWWLEQFSRCLKCYACRAACPMCYCPRCVVECNQPQWVPAAAHPRGNLEWHLCRAMHLAGRCVGCGACARACPVGIPLDLLTQVLARQIEADFGVRAGTRAKADYVLASFRTTDKEDFIR